jgi:hypothetical protein
MPVFGPLLALALALPSGGPASPQVTVSVDSSRHAVTIVTGPFNLPNQPPMDEMLEMGNAMAHNGPVHRFVWPVDGWLRGFEWSLVDARGNVVPREVMHHMIMVNFDRRQLLYDAAERLMGAGSETDDATVPRTIGVPLAAGTRLGFYINWHNSTGHDLEGVSLRLTLLWTPKNQNPRPANAMPIYMDANLTIGGTNTFDVPPGASSKAYEFTLPVGGKLLAVGGHLHDYGTSVRLEDAESGKVLTTVLATRTPEGKVLKVGRRLFGVTGAGLTLKANHRYRVVGSYQNPTGKLIPQGAMAHMVGLFVPDDMARWPAINPDDSTFQKDMAALKADEHGNPLVADEMPMDHDMKGMDHSGHGAAAKP